jgi:hypothetical protein
MEPAPRMRPELIGSRGPRSFLCLPRGTLAIGASHSLSPKEPLLSHEAGTELLLRLNRLLQRGG